jgi:hypothetical protein
MEVNSNPSLNMFLEKDEALLPSQGGTRPPDGKTDRQVFAEL